MTTKCETALSQCFSNLFSRTTVTIQNMNTYRSVLQILTPTFRILVFWDVSLAGRLESSTLPTTKQQRCGNLKFRSCYIPNVTRIDN